MRAGLLIYGSIDTLSGGYLYDRKLVEHLRAAGDQVKIISLPWRNYPSHLLDNFSRSLRKEYLTLKVDVLIQDELNHPSLAWLNQRLSVSFPVLSIVHHLRSEELRPDWQNTIYRKIESRYLNSVDGFIFNSQSTKNSVARASPINKRPWIIATPAGDRFTSQQINTNEIVKRSHQSGPLQLLFLGNLIPRKGLHILVNALAQLKHNAFILEVVGGFDANHDYVRRIFQRLEQTNLKASVRFHGAQDDQTVASFMRKSQVLVVPSSFEGFGIVYLEGMGFGLPAIGTTQGAASEIITHGENGYLIKPEDYTELAVLLRKLSQDRNLLAALGVAAQQRYHQFPGWDQSMAKVRNFLLDMIGQQIRLNQN
jgi:glycosyltransferase involved in cell wall biosynthesis